MGNLLDYTGKIFSDLTVLKRSGTDKHGHVMWLCRCSCNKLTVVSGTNLKTGHTKSCGCLNVKTKHGYWGTPIYWVWHCMKNRCSLKTSKEYKNYGGRGISVCEKWETFEGFLEDMGEIPALGYTLERINNSLGYTKNNCKWATRKQQALNKRSNVYVDTFLGKMTISQISEYTGIRFGTIRSRIAANWSGDSLFKPVK